MNLWPGLLSIFLYWPYTALEEAKWRRRAFQSWDTLSLNHLKCSCSSDLPYILVLISCAFNNFPELIILPFFILNLSVSLICWLQGEPFVGTVASFIGYTFTLTFSVSPFSLSALPDICTFWYVLSNNAHIRFKGWLIHLETFVELLLLLRGLTLLYLEQKLMKPLLLV